MKARGDGLIFQPTYKNRRTGETKTSTIWYIQYFVNGKRRRENSKSRKEADALRLLRKRVGEVAAGKPVSPDIERTNFGNLATALLNDYRSRRRRSIARIEDALEHLRVFFGGERTEDEHKKLQGYAGGDRANVVTVDRITIYKVGRQEQGAANATINRELSALKHAFRLAADAGTVAAVPPIKLLEEDNAREGFVNHSEFERLRTALPKDLKDPVSFLYHSGWRVGEMRTLEWRDIKDGAIRLRRENSKNKKGRVLPLRGELAEIIARAEARRTPECPFVFHRDGGAVGLFRKSWATACTAAGLGALHVHDLRRSAIRNLIRAGVSENVAMKISGHRTASIFRRYDIVTEDDLTAALDRVSNHLAAQPAAPATVVPINGKTKALRLKRAHVQPMSVDRKAVGE